MKDNDKTREQLIAELGELRSELASLRSEQNKLKTRARGLRESNQKLQGCAYLASHDLHAPLISMVRTLNLLIQKAGPVLGTAETAYLRSAKIDAENMLASVRKLIHVSMHSDSTLPPQYETERLKQEEELI